MSHTWCPLRQQRWLLQVVFGDNKWLIISTYIATGLCWIHIISKFIAIGLCWIHIISRYIATGLCWIHIEGSIASFQRLECLLDVAFNTLSVPSSAVVRTALRCHMPVVTAGKVVGLIPAISDVPLGASYLNRVTDLSAPEVVFSGQPGRAVQTDANAGTET